MISPMIYLALLALLVDDPKPVTPVPDKYPPPLPYMTDTELNWRWIHAGAPVGSIRIRFSPIQDQQQNLWRLDSRLSWKRDGRALDVRQKTDFSGKNLKPVSLQRQLSVEATAGGLTDLITAAEFKAEEVRIVVRDPRSGNQVDRVIPLKENCLLLGNQSFEHWLLIGKRLVLSEPKTISALIPGEYRFIDLEFRKERAEKIGDLTVQRWNVSSNAFEAKVWIGENGEVERYRQGEVEIQRIRKRPASASDSPKSPPAGNGSSADGLDEADSQEGEKKG
ncbi:hypothetical protein CBD41_08230 [bacterium TMED181]|nr:hypothetical protein [Planctomycetota bacterium]OUW42943.1 MAG: hypothetical protein CBD41_08230 [bacterium TMED181]